MKQLQQLIILLFFALVLLPERSNAQCDTPCSNPMDWEILNTLTTNIDVDGNDFSLEVSRSATFVFQENCYPLTDPYSDPASQANPTYRVQIVKWNDTPPYPAWNTYIGFHCLTTNLNFTGVLSSSTELIVNETFVEASPSSTTFEKNDLEAGTYLVCVRLGTDAAHSKYKLLSAFTIDNDFYISNQSLSATIISAGTNITSSCEQSYTGSSSNTLLSQMYYILSINTIFGDADDVYLSNDYSTLHSGDLSDIETATLHISATTSSGDYYILFVADAPNDFNETDENNNIAYIAITVQGIPPIPENVQATDNDCNKIRITWDASVSADSYEVFDESNNLVASGITSTYYDITSIPAGITKTYKVKAKNLAGYSDGYGEDVGYRPQTLGTFFPIITATDGEYNNKVRVSWIWDSSTGISSNDIAEYYIYRDGVHIGTVLGTEPYFDDFTAPTVGAVYQVWAVNDCGTSLPGHDPSGYRCPDYDLEAYNYEGNTLFIKTLKKSSKASIINNSTTLFSGNLYLSWHKDNGDFITDLDIKTVTLNQGESITLESDTKPVISPAGNYKIYVKYEDPSAYGTCKDYKTLMIVDVRVIGIPQNSADSRSTTAGDPVDMLTGAFLWGHNDFILKTIAGSIPFQRHYNSRVDYSSGFGNKWTHNFDIRLFIDPDYITLRNSQGKETYFFNDGSGGFEPANEESTDNLSYTMGVYTLEMKDGTKYQFDANGYLISLTYPCLCQFTLGYATNTDGTRRLINIVTPQGRGLFFYYDATKKYIIKIEDNAGREVLYDYNSNNRLIKSTNLRGFDTQYIYDSNNYMLEVIDGKNNKTVVNVYDTEGKVIEQRDAYSWDKPSVNPTTITYDTSNDDYAMITTFSNSLGYQTIYYHDVYYRLVKIENHTGFSREIVYDGFSYRPKTIKDEDGNEIAKYTYDSNGNLIESENALGGKTNITYNSYHKPTLISNSLGHSVSITYDTYFTHKPKTITYGNGYTITINYNSGNGLPASMQEGSNTYSFTYTSFGDIKEVITPTGSYVFDYNNNWGFVSSLRDRNAKTTLFEGDNYGNITKITDPMTYTIERVFDGNGFITSEKDKNGKWSYWYYDERNLLEKFVDANGNTAIEFIRDDLGRTIEAKDAEGHSTYFVLNALNQITSIKNHFNTEIASYVYDNKGNRVQATFGTKAIDYTHNLLGQVLNATLAGKTYKATYNDFGMPLSFVDAKNQTTTLKYDNVMGWLESVTDPENGKVTYTRNLKGGITNINDAEGSDIVITRSSVNNLPLSIKYPSSSGTGYTKYFTYDNEGLLVSSTDEDGIVATITRNDNYEVTGINYSSGENENYTRTHNGWITQITGTRGTIDFTQDFVRNITGVTTLGKTVEYGYDKVYNQTSITYPSTASTPKTVTTTFNELNLPTKTQDWLGNYADFAYSPDFRFLTSLSYSNGVETTLAYDSEERLQSYTNQDASNALISKNTLVYDANNHVISNQLDFSLKPDFPFSENKNYTRDDDGRLESFGTENYTHNQKGARTATTGSKTENYTWTQDDFLASYTKDGITTTNTFDVLGNRIKKEVGTEESNYVLDINGLAQVLQERDDSDNIEASNVFTPFGLGWRLDETEQASFYSFDYKGNTLALTNSVGFITDKYAVSSFGTYMNHQGPSMQPFTFLGRYGVQQDTEDFYYVRARYLDTRIGQFISKDSYPANPLNTQSLQRYAYPTDPLNYVDVNGLFKQDALNGGFNGYIYINSSSAIIQDTYNNLGMALPVNDPFSWIQEMPKQQDVMTMNMSFNFGENSIDYGGGFNNLSVMYPQQSSYAEAQTFCESMEGIHIVLDIAGAIDPTPISDAGNTILYLTCGKWTDAGLTILGIIPYFGDSFKSVKYIDEVGDTGEYIIKSIDDVPVGTPYIKSSPQIGQKIHSIEEFLGHYPADGRFTEFREILGI